MIILNIFGAFAPMMLVVTTLSLGGTKIPHRAWALTILGSLLLLPFPKNMPQSAVAWLFLLTTVSLFYWIWIWSEWATRTQKLTQAASKSLAPNRNTNIRLVQTMEVVKPTPYKFETPPPWVKKAHAAQIRKTYACGSKRTTLTTIMEAAKTPVANAA